MSPSYHSARVLSCSQIGKQVRHLIIEPETKLHYTAGQFFLLRLRHPESGDYIERSYSAANFDDSGNIEFVIRIEPFGQMTSLIDQLQKEDQIDIKGPFGHFGFIDLPDDAQRLVLIAGGVGISPLRSMLQQYLAEQRQLSLQIFYGFRTSTDFLFQEEFETVADQDQITLITSTSEEDPSWQGKRGYITEHLEGQLFPADPQTHAFICGPPPMVKATRQRLTELGYQRSEIHLEAW